MTSQEPLEARHTVWIITSMAVKRDPLPLAFPTYLLWPLPEPLWPVILRQSLYITGWEAWLDAQECLSCELTSTVNRLRLLTGTV